MNYQRTEKTRFTTEVSENTNKRFVTEGSNQFSEFLPDIHKKPNLSTKYGNLIPTNEIDSKYRSLKEALNSKLVFSGNLRKNINSTPSRNSIVPISLSRTMKVDRDDENRIPSPIRNRLSRPNTSQVKNITLVKSSDRIKLNKTYNETIIKFEKEPE